MIFNELIKLFSRRIVILIVIIVILANGYLTYLYEIQERSDSANASSYTLLQKDISEMSDIDKVEYLTDQIEYLNTMVIISVYELSGDIATDEIYNINIKYDIDDMISEYKEGSYIKYTDNMFSELSLYQEVLDEVEQVTDYTYNTELILEKSIMYLQQLNGSVDSYSYRNLSSIYFAYSGIKNIDTKYEPSRGFILIFNNKISDVLTIIVVFLITVILITTEREKRQLMLLKTTGNGRIKLPVVKLIVIVISCFLLTTLLNMENILIAKLLYGLNGWERSIQSVYGYQGCPLKVTITMFLMVFLGGKFLFYCTCATIFFAICCYFRKSVSVYMVTVLLLLLTYMIHRSISNTSNLLFIKELNVFSLAQTSQIFGVYKNIRMGNYPVDRSIAFIVTSLILIFTSSISGCLFFSIRNEKEIRSPFRKLRSRLEGARIITFRNTNIIFHEFYKVFFIQRVLVVLIIAAAFSYLFNNNEILTKTNVTENIYKNYMNENQGKATVELHDYWLEQQKIYQDLINQAANEESFTMETQYRYGLEALDRIFEHEQYLLSQNGSWYLYDEGYKIITNGSDTNANSDIYHSIILVLIGIYCFTAVITIDYQNNEIRLVRSTTYGRNRLIVSKILVGIVIATITYIIVWLPQLVFVIKEYGLPALNAPACSMEHLSILPKWVTIRTYLIGMYALRYLAIIAVMFCAYAITMKVRSLITTLCSLAGILLAPMALYMVGAHSLQYFLFTPAILGNAIFANTEVIVCIFCITKFFVLTLLSIIYVKFKAN